MTDQDIVDLAYRIAAHYARDRLHYPKMISSMPAVLHKYLEALEEGTRGDDRRCCCLYKESGHSVQCPAKKRTSP